MGALKVIERKGKPTKIPFQCNGIEAESDNPATWNTFKAVQFIYSRNPTAWAGIGYMFAADDDFCGVDLDMCLSSNHEFVTDWAEQALAWLPAAYVEFSPSDRGLKIFARGKFPIPLKPDGTSPSGRTFKEVASAGTPDEKKAELAVWNERRFFAVTGRVYQERATLGECQDGLNRLFYSYWPAEKEKRSKPATAPSGVGVRVDALEAMRRCGASMVDGEDGSKRLFAYGCRAVELNCSDAEALATIRAIEGEKPFPRAWTDAEVMQRVRDAEGMVTRGSEVIISNFNEIEVETPGLLSDGSAGEGETKIVTVPKTMGEIVDDIMRHSGGWPRRIDNMLFVDDSKHGLCYFDRRTTAAAFGWLRRHFKVQWAKGGSYAAQVEVFAELERTAERYDAVEVMPHEPPVAGIYYRGNRPNPGDGRHLNWLLKRFRPATTVDGDLIKAAFMTPLWGGAAGRRPAFVFTSDDGRGAGKTTVCEMIGRVYGGLIDVSAGEDIQQLKTRMLSPAARSLRIGFLDNIKSLRLSWAELEALLTAPVISGRQLFVGEAQRPNLLTWLLSLNGVSMATDMAQRSVIIKVVKGENPGDWHEKTTAFIDEHRDKIIGDIIAALRADRFPLASYSRWSTWESEVLCRLPEPGEAQKLILERQGEANCEQDEAEIIEQFFADQLASFGYQPNTAQVRIPVATAAYWFAKAIGEPIKTAAASKRIHQMSSEQQLKRIAPDTSRTYGRGFVWTGPAADIYHDHIDNNLATRIAERLERAR